MQTRTASQVAPLRRLSMKERALWVLQRMVPGSGVSNETLAFTVDGPIVPAILQQTVSHLVTRHPALRTLHPELRGEPVALVLPPDRADVSLQVHRVASGQSADELLTTLARKPFDLSRRSRPGWGWYATRASTSASSLFTTSPSTRRASACSCAS